MTPRKSLLTGLALTAGLAFHAAAQAEVFKCTDARGGIIYTNDRNAARGCKPLSADLPVSQVPSTPVRPRATAPATASPGDFPRVSPEVQRSRDGSRRQILEQELATEERSLDQARRELASQVGSEGAQPGSTQLQPLRDKVDLHQRNVDAIRREIANLR